MIYLLQPGQFQQQLCVLAQGNLGHGLGHGLGLGLGLGLGHDLDHGLYSSLVWQAFSGLYGALNLIPGRTAGP